MRKQVATILLLMLVFAGLGSSALVNRSLAGSKPLTLIQRAKQLGPKPTPRWYWHWFHWRVRADGNAAQRRFRPRHAPHRIPRWGWRRLHFFLLARRLAAESKPPPHSTPQTSSVPTAAGSYEQAISYTQARPAFTPTRTIEVSSAAELQAALSNLQAGDLVKAAASFTVSGETVISARLSDYAVIDLSGHDVKFVYSGGQNTPAVWLHNPSHIRIYGGDLTTSRTGGSCLYSTGAQNVLWWGFVAHDCGAHGLFLVPNTQAIIDDDFQGEISQAGLNLAWDPHAEKGTGLHGAYLGNGSYAFSRNRIALYVHDQPSGAAIQYGADSGKAAPVNNTIYEKADNLTNDAQTQTGGNAIQFWGVNGQSADIKYLEVSNAQGYGLFDGGMNSGTTLGGVTVEYGRASNTNLNPRYDGQNPWSSAHGAVYESVLPAR